MATILSNHVTCFIVKGPLVFKLWQDSRFLCTDIKPVIHKTCDRKPNSSEMDRIKGTIFTL